MAQKLFPHYLFGNYILEIARMFAKTFKNFQLNPESPITPLRIYYGTPKAAFKHFYDQKNGTMILPVCNFWGIDYRRRYDKEPAEFFMSGGKESYDPTTRTVAYMRAPMQFDVTYSFNIVNNSEREKDKMIHKIMSMFPRGQVSIKWYPDPLNYPDIFLYMPLKLDDNFTDETEIEGLDAKETRDQIRTTFNIVSEAVVPYDVLRIPCVTRVFILNNIEKLEGQTHNTFVSLSDVEPDGFIRTKQDPIDLYIDLGILQ